MTLRAVMPRHIFSHKSAKPLAMITRRILLTATLLAIVHAPVAMASDIMVMEPRAAASITPMAKTAAVYVTLMNHGAEADALLKISTPAADMAMAHETTMTDGVMKMREIERLEIKPHETAVLAPGGNHIMLVGLKTPLKEGEQISLVLTFEKAGDVTIDVPVVSRDKLPAATSHEHMEQ
jgi:copper(I)-binding protein